jgi:hypothetical protein
MLFCGPALARDQDRDPNKRQNKPERFGSHETANQKETVRALRSLELDGGDTNRNEPSSLVIPRQLFSFLRHSKIGRLP